MWKTILIPYPIHTYFLITYGKLCNVLHCFHKTIFFNIIITCFSVFSPKFFYGAFKAFYSGIKGGIN